jgi:hypothetical protein
MKVAHDECHDHPARHEASFPMQLSLGLSLVVKMGAPCPVCGGAEGDLVAGIGHSSVRCIGCGLLCSDLRETALGRARQRHRPWISHREKIHILTRDRCACFWCHRCDVRLQIGHLISVCDGRAMGLSDAELSSSENLAAMCASCNAGMWRETMPVWLWAAVLRARTKLGSRKLTELPRTGERHWERRTAA